VEVQELNESGTYAPVEVQPRPGVGTGGIFQVYLDFPNLHKISDTFSS
jgi:hypothetical protein